MQLVLVPFACGDLGDDLLREHVERLLGDRQPVELAAATASSNAAHSTRSSRDSGKSRPFGVPSTACPERPTRCRKLAIERGDPSWQTRSTSPMSMPSSSEAVAASAFSSPPLETLLGVQPQLLGEAAVVRAHLAFAGAPTTRGSPARPAGGC